MERKLNASLPHRYIVDFVNCPSRTTFAVFSSYLLVFPGLTHVTLINQFLAPFL